MNEPLTRLSLDYSEASNVENCCGKCRHLAGVVIPDQLGECGVFASLQKNPAWSILSPLVGLGMWCKAWEGPEKMADADATGSAKALPTPKPTEPPSKPSEAPTGQAPQEIALAGIDGQKAMSLLRHAKRAGSLTLGDIARRALKRGPRLRFHAR